MSDPQPNQSASQTASLDAPPRRRKPLRFLLRALLAVLIGVPLLLLLVWVTVPRPWLIDQLLQVIERETGWRISAQTLHFGILSGLEFEDIEILPPADISDIPFIRADRLLMDIGVQTLLDERIVIHALRIDRPEVILRFVDGRFYFIDPDRPERPRPKRPPERERPEQEPFRMPREVELSLLLLHDATLVYEDLNAELELRRQAMVQHLTISVSAEALRERLKVELDFDGHPMPADYFQAGDGPGLRLSGELTFRPRLTLDGAYDDLTLSFAPDLSAYVKHMNYNREIEDALRIAGEGSLPFNASQLALPRIEVDIGQAVSAIGSGDMDWADGFRMDLDGRLEANFEAPRLIEILAQLTPVERVSGQLTVPHWALTQDPQTGFGFVAEKGINARDIDLRLASGLTLEGLELRGEHLEWRAPRDRSGRLDGDLSLSLASLRAGIVSLRQLEANIAASTAAPHIEADIDLSLLTLVVAEPTRRLLRQDELIGDFDLTWNTRTNWLEDARLMLEGTGFELSGALDVPADAGRPLRAPLNMQLRATPVEWVPLLGEELQKTVREALQVPDGTLNLTARVEPYEEVAGQPGWKVATQLRGTLTGAQFKPARLELDSLDIEARTGLVSLPGELRFDPVDLTLGLGGARAPAWAMQRAGLSGTVIPRGTWQGLDTDLSLDIEGITIPDKLRIEPPLHLRLTTGIALQPSRELDATLKVDLGDALALDLTFSERPSTQPNAPPTRRIRLSQLEANLSSIPGWLAPALRDKLGEAAVTGRLNVSARAELGAEHHAEASLGVQGMTAELPEQQLRLGSSRIDLKASLDGEDWIARGDIDFGPIDVSRAGQTIDALTIDLSAAGEAARRIELRRAELRSEALGLRVDTWALGSMRGKTRIWRGESTLHLKGRDWTPLARDWDYRGGLDARLRLVRDPEGLTLEGRLDAPRLDLRQGERLTVDGLRIDALPIHWAPRPTDAADVADADSAANLSRSTDRTVTPGSLYRLTFPPGAVKNSNLQLQSLRFSRPDSEPVRVGPLEARIDIETARIDIPLLRGRALDGDINGFVRVDLPGPHMRTNFEFTQLDMQTLIEDDIDDARLSGNLELELDREDKYLRADANLTSIGAEMMDTLLRYLDPKDANPNIRNARRQLSLGYVPANAHAQVKDQYLDLDIGFQSSGIIGFLLKTLLPFSSDVAVRGYPLKPILDKTLWNASAAPPPEAERPAEPTQP